MDNCDVPRCRDMNPHIKYYGKWVCLKHWSDHCDNKISLKKIFDIEV